MFVETLQKIAVTKPLASFLLLAIGGFIHQYREEEQQDDAPGDNFPYVVMHQ